MGKISDKIDGLEATALIGTSNMLKFSGPQFALEKLKKELTITNKSMSFQVYRLKKSIKSFASIDKPWAKAAAKKVRAELAVVEDKISTEYFTEDGDSVIAPAGFWYLADIKDESNLNTEIKPVYLKGNRQYQRDSVDELLRYKRATCVLATGLGKSRCIISLAISAMLVGKRTIIIVPTKDLVEQFILSVKDFHQSVTGAHSERKPKPGCDIMVCTVGSAARHADKFDVIAIDENHHNVAETWANLLSMSHAEYVYGFTATPFRSDGMDKAIHAFTGPIVYERDLIWGIKEGWLEKFDAYSVSVSAMEGDCEIRIPSSKANTTAYKRIVGNKEFLNKVAMLIRNAHSSGRRVIVLFKTLAPAKLLAKICSKDIKFGVADAKYKKPLRDFQNGDTNILVATSKLVGEGIDIPGADTLILCTQNSSDVITFQALGRILRKAEDKKKPLLIDIIADGYNSFEESGKKRLKVWDKAADSVTKITT